MFQRLYTLHEELNFHQAVDQPTHILWKFMTWVTSSLLCEACPRIFQNSKHMKIVRGQVWRKIRIGRALIHSAVRNEAAFVDSGLGNGGCVGLWAGALSWCSKQHSLTLTQLAPMFFLVRCAAVSGLIQHSRHKYLAPSLERLINHRTVDAEPLSDYMLYCCSLYAMFIVHYRCLNHSYIMVWTATINATYLLKSLTAEWRHKLFNHQ